MGSQFKWKLGVEVREGVVRKCEASQAEASPSGSQSKWKRGMEVCWCCWTILVSLDYAGITGLYWHVAIKLVVTEPDQGSGRQSKTVQLRLF